MHYLARFLFCLLVSVPVAQASLRTARQARAELGPDVWAQVLRIQNNNPQSIYPATVYATVFEFNDILWFYTATNGTQSFSLHRGRLQEEKADFGPLLRAIDPGFVRAEVLPESSATRFDGPLPNGCFIDSLAALREVLDRDPSVTGAALLSYYVGKHKTLRGHTVLVYETRTGLYAIDPAAGPAPFHLEAESLHVEPVKVARLVTTLDPAIARWVEVSLRGRHDSTPSQLAKAATGAGEGMTLATGKSG